MYTKKGTNSVLNKHACEIYSIKLEGKKIENSCLLVVLFYLVFGVTGPVLKFEKNFLFDQNQT